LAFGPVRETEYARELLMPEVSVIIPAYNAAPYIYAAISSVLSQEYCDLEVIVVDDGSNDGTGDVVAKFGGKIRFFTISNSGPSAARNFGIKKATGRYIAFLDADDWWLPNKLEKQLKILTGNPEIPFVCADWFNGETGDEEKLSVLSSGYKALHQPASFDLMLEENFVNTSTVVVEKAKMMKAGFFHERLRGAEDRHLWLRLLTGGDAYVCKDILAFRRYHPGNTTATLSFIESQVMMMEDLLQWPAVISYPDRLEKASARYNSLLVTNAHRLSTMGRYSESAAIYRQLYLRSCDRFQSGIRYYWFSIMGLLKRS
jgi:glycosyltransferase involved in cell wall biosynthesis